MEEIAWFALKNIRKKQILNNKKRASKGSF